MLSQTCQLKHNKFNQFVTSGLLLIEATIITSIIGAIAFSQPNSFLPNSASAQEAQTSEQLFSAPQPSAAFQEACLQLDAKEYNKERCGLGTVRFHTLTLEELTAMEAEMDALEQAIFQPQQAQIDAVKIVLFTF